ncbi:MAG: hypothetical protein FJ387_14640 [Verrucomicrobia bacterium]|nr:hypothetical protein [Verrucomicrobiota bacterium]
MKATTPIRSLLTAVLLVTSVGGHAATATFAGTFKGDELTITLQAGGSGYTGSIRLGDQTFPLTATERDGKLEGTFQAGDDRFAFTGTMEGDTLRLSTEGTAYTLGRQGGVNPLAKKPPTPVQAANPLARATSAAPPQAAGPRTGEPVGGPAPGAAWKTYRHPTGLRMSYPQDWQLTEHAQMLQLVPPDAGSNADGPTEAYLVFAEAAEDAQSAEDPRVLQYLDAQLGQLMPFLKRTGAPEKIRAGAAPGMLATWEGQNPRGMLVRAYAFATILKGYGVALIAVGDKHQTTPRERTLRGVFASFAAGEGQKDPQIVGTWKHWHYSSSALGGHSTESTRFLRLLADGTCSWSSQTESSGSIRGRDSGGNESWTAGYASVGGDSDQGTWSAGNGKLYVMWQNGSLSEWAYSVSGQPGGPRLLLKGHNQAKPDEWMEQPE